MEDLGKRSADADVSRFYAQLLAEVETDRCALHELVPHGSRLRIANTTETGLNYVSSNSGRRP